MSVQVNDIQNDLNRYIGDSSTNRISATDRLEYITDATIWLQENLKNDHLMKTYNLSYLDTVNYYLVTSELADLLEGSELRRQTGLNYTGMTHKSPRQLAMDISNGIVLDDAWAIERVNSNVYLVINATPQFQAVVIDNFDSGVGNWTADTSTSDMTNLAENKTNFDQGSASASFDISVGQSANNRATMTSTNNFSLNLTSNLNFGVFLIDTYISGQASNVSSYTLYWGTDASNYWSQTVTTDINGNAFGNTQWQTLAFDWVGATQVGTPTVTSIQYFRIDMNYSGGMTNQTAFYYDFFRVANPETLTFHYASFYVGTSSGGSNLLTFSSTTDIPFFSGKYDQYRKAVAHKAAEFAFMNLRLREEAALEAAAAQDALRRAYQIYPVSITKEVKTFAVQGINFARRQVGRITKSDQFSK